MDSTQVERRLAAILAADVVGYSRLMHADDQATLRLLNESRALFSHKVDAHQGHIVNAPGDSVLAEFASVVNAVECALELQRAFALRNLPLPQDQRMQYRIGVNLGDVLVEASGVYGDGVNVAARLESLCEPGAVAISASAFEQVRDRIDVRFTDAGEHSVKNIERPVHVYRLGVGVGDAGPASTATRKSRQAPTPRRRRWQRAVAGAGLLGAALAGTLLLVPGFSDKARRAAMSMAGGKSLENSARATIAVLPFVNQSGDAQRDYFSDGITEDIINALGRFSGVMVISHNAVQVYKGRATSPDQISRELGVRYVARGSVRQADGKLRVAVELSDASTGTQLWSDRFEGVGQQVFELQDQVVRNIVGKLAVKLSNVEQQRVFSKPTESLEAYDLVLRARALLNRSERVSNREARSLLAQALAVAPNYAAAQVALGEAEWDRAVYGWIEDTEEAVNRSAALASKALASDDPGSQVRAHGLLGSVYTVQGKYEQALSEVNRALELNGSASSAYASRGGVLLWQGRVDEAIGSLETAQRFDPQLRPGSIYDLAFAYYMAGRYRDAVTLADRGLLKNPDFHNFQVIRVIALAELGDVGGTRLAVEQVRRLLPLFQAELLGTRFANAPDMEKVQQSLRKAGF